MQSQDSTILPWTSHGVGLLQQLLLKTKGGHTHTVIRNQSPNKCYAWMRPRQNWNDNIITLELHTHICQYTHGHDNIKTLQDMTERSHIQKSMLLLTGASGVDVVLTTEWRRSYIIIHLNLDYKELEWVYIRQTHAHPAAGLKKTIGVHLT